LHTRIIIHAITQIILKKECVNETPKRKNDKELLGGHISRTKGSKKAVINNTNADPKERVKNNKSKNIKTIRFTDNNPRNNTELLMLVFVKTVLPTLAT